MEENSFILRYLLNELSSDEIIFFKKWIDSNPERLKKLEEYKTVLENTKNYPKGFNPDTYKTLANVHKNAGIENHPKSNTRFVSLLKAASAAIFILGILYFTYYFHLRGYSKEIVYTSGYKEIKKIVLPDSSLIWLNENSVLKAPLVFAKNQREVKLRGEAYFEIKRDETKPFLVQTGKTITRVLGTSFNIRLDTLSGNVNINVNSGKVVFFNNTGKTTERILMANQSGIYIESTCKIICSSVQNKNYLAWKTNILTFNNTLLKDVCVELSKQFKKSIKFDNNISDKSLTGTFRNEKLENILKTIELTLDVSIDTSGNEIIIHQ